MGRISLNSNTLNYFALAGKIDPLSEILNAGILTSGEVYWVKDPSDTDYQDFVSKVGRGSVFDTIQAGIDKCVADRNDYVLVCPKASGAAWELSAAIDLNKAKTHLISVGYGRTNVGYSNTLQGYAVGVVHDDEWINISGAGCEVAGFCFYGTGAATAATGYGTVDNALVYVAASDVWVHDCHVQYSGSAQTAWDKLGLGFIAVVGTTEGARFTNVTFRGGTTNAGTPTIINVGNEAKNVTFEDCTLLWHGVDTDSANIRVGTGDIDLLHFKNCAFVNRNAATLPASLITGNVTAEEGIVLFDHCSAVGVTAMGTDSEVFVTPASAGGTVATLLENPGLAIVGSALVPAV